MGIDTKITEEYDAIDQAGGIDVVFITDYHFGGTSSVVVADRFNSKILSSIVEKPKLKKKGLTNLEAFSYERQMLADDLEIIPVPGHTTGGVCLLWRDGETGYLFTGDFLFFDGKTWIPGAKTKRKIEDSLSTLKTLDFDYLVGCASDGVEVPYVRLSSDKEKKEFIDAILNKFEK